MIDQGKTKLFAIIGLTLSLLFSVIAAFSSIPLGIPGDWVWARITQFAGFPLFEFIALAVFLGIAIYCAFKIDFKLSNIYNKLVYVLLIIVMSTMFDYYVLLSGRAGVSEHIFAVIDPYTSGYLMAAGEIKEPGKYFAAFNKVLEKDAYASNHIDVHPFGNIAFSYLVLEWCRKSSTPLWLIEKLLPDGIMTEIREAGKNGVFHGVTQSDTVYTAAAVIVLIFLAMNFAGRLMLVASLLIMTKGNSRNLGLNAVLLGFAIPALILFLGQYDVMMFFIAACCTLLFSLSIKREWKRFPVFSVLTGIMLGIGVLHTLAFVMLILAMLLTVFCSRRLPGRYVKISALIGGGLSVIVVCMLYRIDVITMCLLASRNNSRFFVESGRCRYWFPFNIIDFIVFQGPFLAILPLLLLPKFKGLKRVKFAPVQALALACMITLFILLVSPFSRGELGRLLLFFMPLYSLAACLSLACQKLSEKTYFLCILSSIASVGLLLVLRLALKLTMTF